LNVKDEEVWLVQTEILLSYERELSQVSLTKIDCKIDLETEISKERAKSRFDKAKLSNQVKPEPIKNQPIQLIAKTDLRDQINKRHRSRSRERKSRG
jgi:hypothetical protein